MDTFVTKSGDFAQRMDVGFHSPRYIKVEKIISRFKYRTVPLRSLVFDLSGGATPRAKGGAYTTQELGGIPFLRIQNITPFGIDSADMNYITPEVHEKELKRSQLRGHDLLFTITGRVGTATVVAPDLPPANINQHIVRMSFLGGIDPRFVALWFNSPLGQQITNRHVTGGTRIALDYHALQSLPVPVPPDHVQARLVSNLYTGVANRLRRLQADANALARRAEELVSGALTGEVDVEEVANFFTGAGTAEK